MSRGRKIIKLNNVYFAAIEEGVNHMWTVSAFQQHPNTLMICDEDATLELRVKTVKYFKVIRRIIKCFC